MVSNRPSPKARPRSAAGKPVSSAQKRFTTEVSAFVTAENQRTVGTAKAEGVGQRYPGIGFAALIGHEVQVATFIRVIQVDGWRQNAFAQGQHRDRKSTRLNSSHV